MQIPNQREKRHCFRLADENCDKCPDFYIESSLRTRYDTVLAEVSIVTPLPGVASGEINVPSLIWAADKESQLEKRSQEKTDKYADLAHRSKHGLQPLIFMSTGGIDDATRVWFQQVTRDQAPHLGIPPRVLYKFVLRHISVALQKGIARAINYPLAELLSSTKFPKATFR